MRLAPADAASGRTSWCSCIPATSTQPCSARSPGCAGSRPCSTCSSRSTTPSSWTAGSAAHARRWRSRPARSTRWRAGASGASWSTRPSTPTSSRLHTPRTSTVRRAVGRRRGSALRPADDPGDDGPILWYLTYIPLHGFETVARAAALLGDDGRTFRLVGDGQERATRPSNSRGPRGSPTWSSSRRCPKRSCRPRSRRASICLGVFGTSDKAARVVPNKVFQCAAAGRAVDHRGHAGSRQRLRRPVGGSRCLWVGALVTPTSTGCRRPRPANRELRLAHDRGEEPVRDPWSNSRSRSVTSSRRMLSCRSEGPRTT